MDQAGLGSNINNTNQELESTGWDRKYGANGPKRTVGHGSSLITGYNISYQPASGRGPSAAAVAYWKEIARCLTVRCRHHTINIENTVGSGKSINYDFLGKYQDSSKCK